MPHASSSGHVVVLLTILACGAGTAAAAPGTSPAAAPPPAPVALAIPKAVQVEHEAIHSALVEATKAPGDVGAAARALAEVLHPHFVREEQVALPPLGLLAPLAAGTALPGTVSTEALAMTDALRSELPRMLDEHTKIRAAVETLRAAARAGKATKQEQLAEELALHAQTEEDVLYPAAVLVGDIIRARAKGTP